MRVVIDGLVFSIEDDERKRFWLALVDELSKVIGIECLLLDRGNCPNFNNVVTVPFPSYHFRYTATDSKLINEVSAHFAADIFISSFYTTPLSIPTLAFVYDLDLRNVRANIRERLTMERELCIAFSCSLICWNEAQKDYIRSIDEKLEAKIAQTVCIDVGAADSIAKFIVNDCERIYEDFKDGKLDLFFEKWVRLRMMQATVDVEMMS